MKNQSRKGQSLVEALVAITILMTGMIGILTLLSKSFFLDRTTGDETKATYLAAEGIEITKSLLDHDVYQYLAGNGGGWGSCFNGFGADFEVDYTTVNCPGGGSHAPTAFAGDQLLFDPTTGLYGYESGNPTGYVREIILTKPSAYEIDVESIVTWSDGPLTNQSITLDDHFYNWHP